MQLQYMISSSVTGASKVMKKMMENRITNLLDSSSSLSSSSSSLSLSNPHLIQNPSFLHGNETINDKYVTLDSLALKRTSLPLQLVPTSIDMTERIDEEIPIDTVDTSLSVIHDESDNEIQSGDCSKENEASEIPQTSPKPADSEANKKAVDLDSEQGKELRISWEERTATTIQRKISSQQNKHFKRHYSSLNVNGKCVVKPKTKWFFSSKVLHYVPKRGKRHKKICKKLKDNLNRKDKCHNDWTRRSVSLPTDFVHVAGVTRWSWLEDSDSSTYDNSSRIITHEEKCATLMLVSDKQNNEMNNYNNSSSLETLVEESTKQISIKSVINTIDTAKNKFTTPLLSSLSKLQANQSFLWSNIAKSSNAVKIVDRLSDKQCKSDNEVYDDVGTSSQMDISENQDEIYDDVGLSGTHISKSIFPMNCKASDDGDDDGMYDDVIPLAQEKMSAVKLIEINNEEEQVELRRKVKELSINSKNVKTNKKNSIGREKEIIYPGNNYSSVGDTDEDDTLYDDVIVPSESRVNSIYAGSINISSIEQSKESDWEDLEEYFSCSEIPKTNSQSSKSTIELPCTSSKRKSGQRWTRKVRRQRSKASQKNSTRSSKLMTRQSTNFSDTESDDSNYETLCSLEPVGDSFNNSTENADNENSNKLRTQLIIPGPPLRPVPPPPRESTLTETFGKRMKILKRTWSITKGSLGRMRRKTSFPTSEADSNVDDSCPKFLSHHHHHHHHHRYPHDSHSDRKSSQVFNFKKHFQKSINSLSTFYLDNENHLLSSKNNNNTSIDEIYGTSNWYASSNYTSRHDSTDDYSMLLEEPLYQFYAAATVRGAFQSDSESYEETENSKSLASTSELSKPGHRTLWCQTPQIINSDLLGRLTSDEKKIQEAKFEILTSEASYLNSLRVLVNEYVINHELVYDALTASEREKLFGNVPSVLIASERLLAELESIWRADSMLKGIPNILLQHAERCSKVYIEYCSNQVSIDMTLKELRVKKSSKFNETVTRIESHPASQSLSLHSFLMLPMQRVTRLPLLADAVLSKLSTDHEERLQWEKVLSVLSKVVTECNEAARNAGRQIEMENLSKKMEYSPKVSPIDLHDRYLIRSGPVTQITAKPGSEYILTFRKKFSKISLYLLLLNDHLLIAKMKSNNFQDESYSVIDSCKRSLIALERVPDDSPFATRHSMILTLLENHCGRHVEYILSCNSATDRERWLDAASPPKTDTVGETLYETWDCPQVMALYSYTPSQPDELSLQPGDVINVLRKLPDGWNLGEKLVGGEQGWFPDNFTREVASEHVRARNLRQRHRLLALSESLVQQRAKQVASMSR